MELKTEEEKLAYIAILDSSLAIEIRNFIEKYGEDKLKNPSADDLNDVVKDRGFLKRYWRLLKKQAEELEMDLKVSEVVEKYFKMD